MLVVVNSVTDSEADLLIPWCITPGAELRLHFWGDECVLFHGAAGNTHLLPEVVGQLLQALTREATSISSLSTLVDLHVADVSSSLHEMSTLGIAERVA